MAPQVVLGYYLIGVKEQKTTTVSSALRGNLGAIPQENGCCSFRVWAPELDRVSLRLDKPRRETFPLTKDERGYHHALVDRVQAGARYGFVLDDGRFLPDPASRSQPDGVHEASAVVSANFPWTDQAWRGVPLEDWIVYELHIGTFTPEGTFDAARARLKDLKDLGITAVELMPVAQFPGDRNWGYDGVYPFAVQHSYGGPEALKRFVDAAHGEGLAVILDVVYNHLGPEGNYMGQFAPYFTDHYKTPWGAALNFDGPDSDGVRDYFTENALCWQTEFHMDALRLDAVHAICDFSAVPFLEALGESCRARALRLGRPFLLIAESDMNMARHILPRERGGYGLDGQWSDDFHHALHVLLTGESAGYYSDFGGVADLARVLREGYAFTGQYSRHRRRRHGSSPEGTTPRQFVVCSQNHDQVGNRMKGDRLSETLSLEKLKLAAGTVLLSPFVPLLFMGEEYGETAPFQYFTSHSDPGLVEAVRRGRQAEFASFRWGASVPDPQAPETFRRSQLNWAMAGKGRHASLREFYRETIALRKALPPSRNKDRLRVRGFDEQGVVVVTYRGDSADTFLALCFADSPVTVELELPSGRWRKRLDSTEARWSGSGSQTAEQLDISRAPFKLALAPSSLLLFQKD